MQIEPLKKLAKRVINLLAKSFETQKSTPPAMEAFLVECQNVQSEARAIHDIIVADIQDQKDLVVKGADRESLDMGIPSAASLSNFIMRGLEEINSIRSSISFSLFLQKGKQEGIMDQLMSMLETQDQDQPQERELVRSIESKRVSNSKLSDMFT